MNNTERSFDRFSFFDLLSITQASSDKKKEDSKNEETGRKQSLKKSFSDALKKSSEEMEEKKLRAEEQIRRDKERHERYLKRQLEREKNILGGFRKKYNVQYKFKGSPSMGMIDDIKKTYELTETELNDLEKGVHGMEMQRQKSFHTINKMNTKDKKTQAIKEKCKIQ